MAKNQVTSRDKINFDVWSDGSASSRKQKQICSGIGYVTIDHRANKVSATSGSMESPSGSSLVTEFHAAAAALNSINHDAVIRLHTDCLAVYHFIQSGKDPSKKKRFNRKQHEVISNSVTCLKEALEKHANVIPIQTKDTKDKMMKIAHNLASQSAHGTAIG